MKFKHLIVTALGTAVLVGACNSGGATTAPATAGASSAPASTAPESTAPESTAPESTAPESTTPESAAPSAGTESAAPSAGTESAAPSAGGDIVTDSPAADLRTKLDLALGEHIIFASKATGAALGGRDEEFAAYGDLLNKNGTDLGDMIGAAFGPEAADAFNKIWSAHNGFFVDYTVGVAKKDQATQDKAVKDLTTIYVPQFSELIAGATGLPMDAVAELTTQHVLQTKAIVDAQGAKDWKAAYAAIRTAYAHMQMIGDAIAPAIATKFPDKFSGDPSNKGVGLRVALNQLLQEHLYLASSATGAALDGRDDEFAAAGDVLNTNGTDIGAAIGSLYGPEAGDQFNKIWSAHNGFFVDYTVGVAKKDQAMQDKAVSDLTTVYLPQFAEFLAGATGLPNEALTGLIEEHVLTTKDIVDAQASKDAAAAAAADRAAGQHMQMIADPLAGAIVAKLPDMFR
ncbi:MAG: hypothetical protein WKF78_07870 [Candidatus Limnocylindrales bacterium]